jgi:hypothetical protein
VVSFTLWQLYSRGNRRRYQLDSRLDGPQIRSGRYGVNKNVLSMPGIEVSYLGSELNNLQINITETGFQLN